MPVGSDVLHKDPMHAPARSCVAPSCGRLLCHINAYAAQDYITTLLVSWDISHTTGGKLENDLTNGIEVVCVAIMMNCKRQLLRLSVQRLIFWPLGRLQVTLH